MSDTPTNGAANTAGDAGSNTNAQPAGQQPDAGQTGSDKQFNQADVDRIVKQRLEDDRRARKREADEQKAKEQGEWQQVATQHESRVKELEPQIETVTSERDSYATLVDTLIKPRLKALPDELRALMPDEATPQQRVEQLIKLEAAASKLQGQRTPGTPSGPVGTGAIEVGHAPTDLIARKRASGHY